MREMKDSGIEWVGEIPEKWTKDKVIRLFNIIGSGTTPKNITSDFPCVNWIQSGDINGSLISDCKNNISKSIVSQYSALKIYAAPFIVIAMYGASVGNISISLINGCVNQACCVLSTSICNLNYAFYAIKSSQNYLVRKAIGGGQPNINQDTIKQLWLPLPALPEQERIAAFLDAECAEIDAVLEKTRASIEEYKKLKQAVITQAVTKGVRGDRPMKDSGIEWIGEIPVEWEIRKIFRAINKVGDIDHYMPDSVDDGIPYLMTGDLQEKLSDVNLKSCKKVSFQDYEILSTKIKVNKGDVIFARYATIGTVCLVDTEDNILVSYACLIIKPNLSLLCGEFLFYYLKSTAFLEEIKQYIKANTQANVGLDSVTKAKIALPSVQEQQEIVDYLRDKCKKIDELIAKKQQYLTEIENYKKSLIYEYVTGKKEVV